VQQIALRAHKTPVGGVLAQQMALKKVHPVLCDLYLLLAM